MSTDNGMGYSVESLMRWMLEARDHDPKARTINLKFLAPRSVHDRAAQLHRCAQSLCRRRSITTMLDEVMNRPTTDQRLWDAIQASDVDAIAEALAPTARTPLQHAEKILLDTAAPALQQAILACSRGAEDDAERWFKSLSDAALDAGLVLLSMGERTT